MTRTFDCPFCGGLIPTDKMFGIETCPTCGNVMGLGDLLINQNIIDRQHDEEQKAEIAAENAWMRAGENSHVIDYREEELIANDPWFQEVAERQYQDMLVWDAQQDMSALLLDGGM